MKIPDINYILRSKYFSGNELAKLAGINSIPSLSANNFTDNKDQIILDCKKLLSEDQIDKAWQLVIHLGNILIEK